MIRFNCPSCDKSYHVDDKHAGKASKCKACGSKMQVPAKAAETVPPSRPSTPPQPTDDGLPEPPPARDYGFHIEDQVDGPAEEHPRPPRRSSPARRRKREAAYPMLTIVAWVTRILGAVVAAVGVLVILISLLGMIGIAGSGGSQNADAAAGAALFAGLLGLLTSFVPIISGVFIMASGEVLFALRDIATNTGRTAVALG